MNSIPSQESAAVQATGRQLRVEQARQLAAIMKQPPVSPESTEFTPTITRDRRFDDKYGVVGEQMCADFVRRAHATGDERLLTPASTGAPLHGCYVLSRIMSFGPAAYVSYTKTRSEQPPTVAELAKIMLCSRGVARTFADLTKKDNTTIETTFGLLGFPPMYDDTPPFEIGEESGEAEFIASPRVLRYAQMEALQIRLRDGMPLREERDAIHCPAIGKVLDTLWASGVTICAQEPHLYPEDMQTASGANGSSM